MGTMLLGQNRFPTLQQRVEHVQGADCMKLGIQPVSEISDGYLICNGVEHVLLEFAKTTSETGVYLNRRNIQRSYGR